MKKPINLHSIDGKMPPQAIELEDCIIGAVMLEPCLNELMEIISANSFYRDANSRIFQACINLFKRSEPVDILTVTQELKNTGELEIVGGAYYISQLTNRVASAGNVEYHARIVQQKFLQREIIRICTQSISESYEDFTDVFDVLEGLEKGLTGINNTLRVGKVSTMAGLWNEVLIKNEILLTNKGISGVESGYENIDKIIGGWQKSDLIIIAARPAMGKTSLAINFARNASVSFKKGGLVFSLEMSALQIAIRSFALESNISISEFSRKGIPAEQMFFVEKDWGFCGKFFICGFN